MRHHLANANAVMRRPLSQPWIPVFAVVGAVIAPIVFAAVRAAWGDWVPAGDDAYFTVRSRDVATVHHPLLGAWSSGSLDLAEPINNLGPMQLDIMAPFTKLAPMGGTALSVALTNVAAIVAIVWMVVRLAGRRAAVASMVPVALLTWTMGSEMLITPRQHQYLILPYLCLLVAAWATANGDRWAIVIGVASASLVAQTHLSYPVLVAGLSVTAIGLHVIATRRGEALGGRRPVVVAAVLAGLLWVQTGIDQFAGLGNLGAVLFGPGGSGGPGLTAGVRIVVGILVSPVTLFRPGYQEQDAEALFASPLQLAVALAVAGAATVFVVRAWRSGRWRSVSGIVTAFAAVGAGVVDAALLPRTVFGLAIMNYRWLWATAAFLVLVAAVAVAAWAEREPRLRRSASWAAAVLCAVLAIANLPRSVQHSDAARYLEEQRGVASALDQLGRFDLQGPLIIDESEMYFGHPYTYPVLVEMQEQGVAFRFESPLQERRFGARRVADGTETRRLRLISGEPALALASDPTVGDRLLAFVPGTRPVAILLDEA